MGDTLLFYVGTPTPILHTYRLLSDGVNEGFVSSVFAGENYEWHKGPTVSMAKHTNSSTGDDLVESYSPAVVVPSGISVAPAGRILEDYYQTVMDSTATCDVSVDGGDSENFCWSNVYVSNNPVPGWPWEPFWKDTHYIPYDPVYSPVAEGFTMREFSNTDGGHSLKDITDRVVRYYPDGTSGTVGWAGYNAVGEQLRFNHTDETVGANSS